MRRLWGIGFLFMAVVLLNGCILSASPSSSAVSVTAGDSISFGIKTLGTPTSVTWTLDSTVVSGATTRYFTYTPDTTAVGTHTLSVAETSKLFGSGTRTWTIEVVAPPEPIEISTQAQAQNLLYTAYAGIGYGRATSYTDDEPLYDIMFDDLNNIAVNFVEETIFNDPDAIAKLLAVAVGGARTFSYTTSSGVVSSLYVNGGSLSNGYRSFGASLSVNFNATGYPQGNGLFYGDTGGVDLTGTVSGYFKYSSSDGTVYLYVRHVTIQAKNTLRAVYPLGVITYGASDGTAWQIAYDVFYGDIDPNNPSSLPWNAQIIPVVMTSGTLPDEDFRDYTLSGAFALDGSTYLFPTPGMRYRQWQLDYNVSGTTVTRYLLALSGTIQTPDVPGAMAISSSEDTTDPLGSGTIVRSLAGIWTSGLMSLGNTDIVQASFNNGTCDFTGVLGSWSVANWQNALEP